MGYGMIVGGTNVTTRSTPLTDAESGVRVLRILEACQASLEQNGRPVSPDER